MPKIPRYLITTADERTWKFDRPVIFLGEWCRLFDRKNIWQGMNAIVAAPYGLGQAQKDGNHIEARALEERLLPILCSVINQHHGTNHGPRFWRIVLGHWLRQFVDVILNRIRTLEQCFSTHQLCGTTGFTDSSYMLATVNSNEAIWAFSDDRWNNILYVRILNLLGVTSCPVEVINDDASENFRWHATATRAPLQRRILMWGYQQVGRVGQLLVRDDDAFIFNSYLPIKEELKLQLALGQVPQLWSPPKLELTKRPDQALRHGLSNEIAEKHSDTLFGVMCSLVFELLPVCYLEGFTEMSDQVNQFAWPSKPKLIFSSGDFGANDVLRLWAAAKIESGAKYVAGQHGNNYGTHRYMCPSIEEATADKFLTWGWSDGMQQHTPAFIFKTVGCKPKNYNPRGGLLLIELCLNHRISTEDGTYQFAAYFSDQQVFVGKLQTAVRDEVTIRLHADYRHLKWSEQARWHQVDPALKIDTGRLAIRKLISRNRLIVHSYDSTGILETLSQNIPTLAFWQNDFEHLRDSAKPYYQMLVDVGIVHLTPESAAAKVSQVWDDVAGWWSQPSVQEARKIFCARYARVSQHPVRDIKALLQELQNAAATEMK